MGIRVIWVIIRQPSRIYPRIVRFNTERSIAPASNYLQLQQQFVFGLASIADILLLYGSFWQCIRNCFSRVTVLIFFLSEREASDRKLEALICPQGVLRKAFSSNCLLFKGTKWRTLLTTIEGIATDIALSHRDPMLLVI